MHDFTRRDVVLSAGAAAALGATGSIAFAAPDPAIAAGAEAKGFYQFRVGDLDITTVFDGHRDKPHDPGFIKNATVEDTKAALKLAGLDDSKVVIPFTVTVVKKGDQIVMFDAGTGAQLAPTAGRLAANLRSADIDPRSINAIIVTHFHPDHIFGLMEKDTNAQVYPDAEIVVPAKELAFWGDEGVFTKLPETSHGLAKRIQATLAKWKNVRTVDDGAEAVPGVTAHAAHGHTPGHTAYALGSGGEELLVLGDITNIPALFAVHPDWHVTFDADPVAAEAARRKYFDRVISDNAIMTGYHYGMPGAGRIKKDGTGYAYLPIA